MNNGEKPKRYMERELTEENIPFIAQQSGKTPLELQIMLLQLRDQGRLGAKVRWEVKDE